METLSLFGLEIGNAMYRVYPLTHGYENGFRKNNAYRITSDIDDAVYPYRGTVKSFKKLFSDDELLPGLYGLEGKVPTKLQVKPAKGKDRELYDPEMVINLLDRDSIEKHVTEDDIIEVKMNASGGAAWMPEIREDDDPNTLMLKAAIRLKRIAFADYGPRFEVDAVGKGQGSKGTSAKSNSKRAIENNNATSMSKMLYYCNVLDLEPVIGLRDRPGARDPAFKRGQVMLFYPSGEPFPLDDTITFDEMKKEIDMANFQNSQDSDDDEFE